MKYDRKEIIIRKNMAINKTGSHGSRWTTEEEKFLKENKDIMSLLELSEALKRTPWAIAGKKRYMARKGE